MLEQRVLTADDWRLWREIRLAALAEAPYAYGSTLADWADADEQRWRDRLNGTGYHNVAALLDGIPVGIASGLPTDLPDVVALTSMYVSPAARGRGVGDRLVDTIATWAAARGATTLRLDVTEGNEYAVKLYRRNGFRDTTPRVEPGPHDIRYERTMVRPLA